MKRGKYRRCFLGFQRTLSMRSHRFRISLMFIVIVCSNLGIVARLIQLQCTGFGQWRALAQRQQSTSVLVYGARGSVFDREGRPLAVSVPTYSLAVHPEQATDRLRLASALTSLGVLDEQSLGVKLKTPKPFVWLKREVARDVGEKLEQAQIPGLVSIREFGREYPQESLASQVIGRVNQEGVGHAGVEQAFERRIAAESEELKVRRDARGNLFGFSLVAGAEASSLLQPIAILSSGKIGVAVAQEPIRDQGHDIALSLDGVIQEIVEEEIQRAVEQTGAKAAQAVILDAQTGEVLAMAQTPRFRRLPEQKLRPEELKNIVIEDSFEPGSTLKPIVAGLALEKKRVTTTELIDCENGTWGEKNFQVHDVHPMSQGKLRDILVQSSNIGMAKIGSRLGRDELYRGLLSFGFGKKTKIELPGEAAGILRSASSWAPIDVATHSFGQGISLTSVQLAVAYSAIANGGYLVQPSILKGGRQEDFQRVLHPSNAKWLRNTLIDVTEAEEGTGKNAAISNLRVAGKTGTAQKALPGIRGYSPDKVLSSFVGFIDAQPLGLSRVLTMVVVIDEPQTKPRWGGVVAAPVFRRSMKRILSYLLTKGVNGIQTVALDTTPNHS